jgi:hypothetical protein
VTFVNPTAYRIEHCRGKHCDAPIIWAITTAGKFMPVDAEPTPDGNVELSAEWPALGHPSALVHAQPPLDPDAVLRLPHHATCPDAAEWKR